MFEEELFDIYAVVVFFLNDRKWFSTRNHSVICKQFTHYLKFCDYPGTLSGNSGGFGRCVET